MCNPNVSQKMIDCLRIAAAAGTDARGFRFLAAVGRYGRKPVKRKIEELTRRGYIQHPGRLNMGGAPYLRPLTHKGREMLAQIMEHKAKPQHFRMPSAVAS